MRIKLFTTLLVLFVLQTSAFCANYVYKKLDSGQAVIVNEMRDNPIVTINTWVKTGSINEDDTNTGVAHFLEHLFFKGSKNVQPGEFDRLLESKGAITNAATSKDYTQFYITIPSKDFDLALRLHSDMLLNPLIPRKELEKERLVVLEEIARGQDNPLNVVYKNLFKLVYSNDSAHPYMRPVIGSREVISTITREHILDFYNEWYTPDNMITIVSGDVDANYAIAEIEKAFKREPIKRTKRAYPAISPIAKQLKINETKDVAQGYMAIAYRAPKFVNTKDAYALDILAVILGGSNSSILNSDLKEKKALVNTINASYSQYMDDGLFAITSTFAPDKIKDVQKEIFEQIEIAKKGGITNEQVQKAKTMIRTSTDYARESAANIANELGYFTLYFNSPKMYDDYLKYIDSIQLKDVIQAANKYLIKEKTAISTVMPEGFVEVSNVAHAIKVPQTVEESKNKLNVLEKTNNETKYLLDNGAILIVRKNASNSIVAFDIFAKGGSFLADKPGVSYLAASCAKRGTKTFGNEEMNTFLDENGIKLGFGANDDAFNISLMTTKNKLSEGLMVLDEVVNTATFKTIELEKVKNNYKEQAKTLKDRPLSLALDELAGSALVGYPYSYNSRKRLEYIDDISREEVVEFYNKVLDSKNLVIAVVGDVDDNKIADEMNRIFKDRGQKKVEIKDFLKESYVPSENQQIKLSNSGKETSWIIAAYKTPNIYDTKEIATLKVIDSLLGTGMSSRLFKSLRENQGLAYQVGSQISQYGNDGLFFAYIGTNTKNEEVALCGILSEIDKLKSEFVSAKELQEAKDKLLGNIIIALETNMDRASYLSKYSTYEFDLQYLEKLKEEIQNVSASDILSFANKYFARPHFEVIIGK